jgi:hypothetical protein
MNELKLQKLKIVLGLIALAAIGYFGFTIISLLRERPLGMALNQAQFQTATSAQVSCATSATAVIGVQSGRTSFLAANVGANGIFLCRTAATGCSATSGIPLVATTSNLLGLYEQKDGYTGAYSCIANTAAALLNVSYSQ